MLIEEARFYVYELVDGDGVVLYVGKGCDRRFHNQKRKFRLDGRIVARFADLVDSSKTDNVRRIACYG